MDTGLVSQLTATSLPRHTALKAALSASGVRQFAVARRIGISDGQLSKLLAGHKPLTDEMAARIGAAIEDLVSAAASTSEAVE